MTKLMLSRKHMTATEAAMEKLRRNYEGVHGSRDYGNGRFVRKMLEEAEMNLSGAVDRTDGIRWWNRRFDGRANDNFGSV